MQAIDEAILTGEKAEELGQENGIVEARIEQLETQSCRKDACPYLDGEPVLRVKAKKGLFEKRS